MGFLSGKRAFIVGVATDRSIAWGIAQAMHREGAELAFSYVNDKMKERVEPLAQSVGSRLTMPLDVTVDGQIDAAFDVLKREWGSLDIVVHAVAYAPREAIAGGFVANTSREAFRIAHDVSSYSFTALARGAAPLMAGRSGALLTLSGYFLAWLINSFDLPAVPAMVSTVLFGVLVAGVTNGFLIGRLKLSFMIVTLGTMTLFAGLAKWITVASEPIVGSSGQANFLQNTFYQGSIAGIPLPVAVCIVTFIVAAYVLRFTLFGRDVFAVGGNPKAARLSGINVSWTLVAVYAIAGGAAALGSVISTSITSSAINTAGDSVMLQAAAAVLVGGTSLRGGSGTITGTAIGVLFFGVLHQGLQRYNTAWEQIISGAIVAGAALADKVQRDGWASLDIRTFGKRRSSSTA